MSSNSENPADLLSRLASMAPPGLLIPPPVFIDMAGEFLDYDEAGKMLVARFPVQERYLNPVRYVQGGIIVTAMDNTVGPLSYLVAPPSVTLQFNTTFLRPLMGDAPAFIVTARVTDQTRRYIYMEALATSLEGRVLARAQVSQTLIGA